MNFLVITNCARQRMTGGQIVDEDLYECFRNQGHSVVYNTDFMPNMLNRYLIFALVKKIFAFRKYDQIFINAYLCHVFLLFLLLSRIIKPNSNVTIVLHHFRYMQMTGIKSKWFHFLEFLALKLAGHIIVVSPYIYDLTKRFVPEQKISYIGIAFSRVAQKVRTHKYGKILFVGTVEPRKGVSYLVEALGILPDTLKERMEVNLVGKHDPDYVLQLKKRIKELSLESIVNIRGRVDETELETLYDSSMFFVFPSLLEGFGMVLVEAMGHGLPVVAFDNSAMPYTVKNNVNGCLVETRNAQQLAAAIERLLVDSAYYCALVKGAENTFKSSRTSVEFEQDVVSYLKRFG